MIQERQTFERPIHEMNASIDTMNAWAQMWTSLVWAVLWQSTLLAAVVALIAFALRRSSPALRFWLWQIVAIKLLLMPFWTLAVPLPLLRGAVVSDAANGPTPVNILPVPTDGLPVPVGETPPTTPAAADTRESVWTRVVRQITWQSWLLLGWLAVVFWQVARLALQRVRLSRLLRRTMLADSSVTTAVNEIVDQLRLRRRPQAVFTDVDCSPFVCGLCRPILVLPRALAASLGAAQLRQVLLHELAHVRRRDLVWSWLPEIMRIVYFFHPVVHWVSYRIRLERELACDQLAMSASGTNAADYAETLVQVVSHSSQPAVLKAAAASSVGLGGHASLTKPMHMTEEHP